MADFTLEILAQGEIEVSAVAAGLIIAPGQISDLEKVQSVVFQSTDGVAPNGNSATATISIGNSGVVAGGAVSIEKSQSIVYSGDWEPGSSAFLDVEKLYAISDTAGQKLQWQALGG